MTDTPVTQIFEQLADVRRSIASVSGSLRQLQETENELRTQLHDRMQRSETKTIEGSGLQAVRSSRKSVVVTDEAKLREHLTAVGLDQTYTRLDITAAKKDGAKQGWPGVEEVITDVLSIRESKS